MQAETRIAFISAAILIAGFAIVYWLDIFGTHAAHECFVLYQDILPDEAEIIDQTEGEGIVTVQYRHNAGTGSISCTIHGDGSLDFEASMNHKIDLIWDNPDIKPR